MSRSEAPKYEDVVKSKVVPIKGGAKTEATKTTSTQLVPLFVYGTLKQGMPLSSWLDGQTYVCDAIMEGAALLNLGPYPALIDKLPSDRKVKGEYWLVEMDQFATLRDMEEGAGYTTASKAIKLVTEGGEEFPNVVANCFVMLSLGPSTHEWKDSGERNPKSGVPIYHVAKS